MLSTTVALLSCPVSPCVCTGTVASRVVAPGLSLTSPDSSWNPTRLFPGPWRPQGGAWWRSPHWLVKVAQRPRVPAPEEEGRGPGACPWGGLVPVGTGRGTGPAGEQRAPGQDGAFKGLGCPLPPQVSTATTLVPGGVHVESGPDRGVLRGWLKGPQRELTLTAAYGHTARASVQGPESLPQVPSFASLLEVGKSFVPPA